MDNLGVKPAPVMAFFSSRGPNSITAQIIKPDITAPGVGVIAAYSEAVSPTGLSADDRRVKYTAKSGTSMACPHVSGIVGLIKTVHPKWTPAMIKSAIMTTATNIANDNRKILDQNGEAATVFSYGSGHVKPIQALDPGLVYDTTLAEYASFLCSMKPNQNLSTPLFNKSNVLIKCNERNQRLRPEDLNYPSIGVTCLFNKTEVQRRVKNVGVANSKYTVEVTEQLAGITVTVEPTTLFFPKVGDEKIFTVKLKVSDAATAANYLSGSIEWSTLNGKYRVRSPISATTGCD